MNRLVDLRGGVFCPCEREKHLGQVLRTTVLEETVARIQCGLMENGVFVW